LISYFCRHTEQLITEVPISFVQPNSPPGTGKTKTILGLVASLISQQARKIPRSAIQTPVAEQASDLTGKLLICAPSNAAVDEIVKRLMQGIPGPEGKMHPKIVRIGKSESINSSVKEVCLETLIEKEIESLNMRKMKNDKKGNPREKLLEEMRKIKLLLDELEKEMAQAEGDPVKYATINDRRRALMGKKRNLAVSLDEESNKRTEFSRDLEIAKQRAKKKILSEADVVSCTLSGSGHEMLASIGISFETVIIDEAAQSIEISSLIPLKYDCQRCVLVGGTYLYSH
jgi:superfamily I DNA and/or RNA helicase